MQSCFHTYENVTCHTEIWRYDLEIWSGDMGYARAGRKKQRGKGVCFHNTSSFYQSPMLRECSTHRSSRGEDIEVSYRHRRYWTTRVSLVWNCFHTHENVDDGMKLRLFGMKCWRYKNYWWSMKLFSYVWKCWWWYGTQNFGMKHEMLMVWKYMCRYEIVFTCTKMLMVVWNCKFKMYV